MFVLLFTRLAKHDVIPVDIMKSIPKLLDNPIVITEYVDNNGMHSANVYGNLFIGTSPVVVGVMMTYTQKGVVISKIQTVHPNRNALKEMTSDKILYLSENKKEANKWFQSLNAQMPFLGEIKYGFNRMIAQNNEFVNSFPKESYTGHTSRELPGETVVEPTEKKLTNRAILANTLESAAKTDAEKARLAEYKKKRIKNKTHLSSRDASCFLFIHL